jgi:hypothetical protein
MNSIVAKFIGTWLHPWQSMDMLKLEGEDASIKPAMIYIVVLGLISGLITSLYGVFLPSAAIPGTSKAAAWLALALVPAVSFIGSFIGAFIIWGLVDGWLKGTQAQYKTAYRLLAVLAAFSPVSALLAPIPRVGQYLSIAVNIWATIVMIRGIIIVRDTPRVRTWVICLSLFVFLFAVGLMARIAAQRQLATGNNFGAFGGATDSTLDTTTPADDLGETSDNLDKELQDLADKAKKAPTTDAQPATSTPSKK